MDPIGTHDMEFMEYVGVMGVMAFAEVDMLLTSGYNFWANIFKKPRTAPIIALKFKQPRASLLFDKVFTRTCYSKQSIRS